MHSQRHLMLVGKVEVLVAVLVSPSKILAPQTWYQMVLCAIQIVTLVFIINVKV